MPSDPAELVLPSTPGTLPARWQLWPSDCLQLGKCGDGLTQHGAWGRGFFGKIFCNSGRLMKSVVSQAALCFQGCQAQQKTVNCGATLSSVSQEEAEIVGGGALGQVPPNLC